MDDHERRMAGKVKGVALSLPAETWERIFGGNGQADPRPVVEAQENEHDRRTPR